MKVITESTPLATPTGSRWRAKLLSAPIQGSSGFYPMETVRRDGPAAFPASTPIYFDHPSESDRTDRPERSVRDLAGKITSTPVFESDGLYADVEFYSWAADVVKEMGGDIGLSIRAAAEATRGEVNGEPTLIITKLIEGMSVDLVTKAGAGGKLVQLLESARPSVMDAATITTRLLAETLSTDRRDQLAHAVRAVSGRDEYAYVCDFDDDTRTVYYAADDKTWQQAYTVAADDLSVALTGDRTEVRPVTTYHSVVTSAEQIGESSPPTTTPKEKHMEITEARYAELTATADRVTALEAERTSAIQRAEAAEADARTVARDAYTTQVGAALQASTLPDPARNRVAEALRLPDTADVPADAAVAIEAAIKAEAEYLTQVAPTRRPLGFGAPVTESARTRTRSAWGTPLTKEA